MLEQHLTNYSYTSSRLLSFIVTLFSRLDLASNNFAWNAVRLCVRDGFYVRHADTNGVQPGQIVCFACNWCAYGSLSEFAHVVYNAFHDAQLSPGDRDLGLVPVSNQLYRLPHAEGCDRRDRSVDNLAAYTDLLFVRRMFASVLKNNQLHTHTSEALACRVCYNRPVDVATVPCGHVYACFECLLAHLRNANGGTPIPCFVCRTPVRGVQQLYFA